MKFLFYGEMLKLILLWKMMFKRFLRQEYVFCKAIYENFVKRKGVTHIKDVKLYDSFFTFSTIVIGRVAI